MTLTQVLLLILVLLAVAVIAYLFGRSSNTATSQSPLPNEPIARQQPPHTEHRQVEADPGPRAQRNPAPSRSPANRSPANAGPAGVATWGYQLQNLKVAQLDESPADLLVVDYTKDGSDESAFTPAELERLKTKPDGSRRLMIAYLSIGEAESYRSYWQPTWKKQKPAWLLDENPEWEENYAVCFWDQGWQAIMFGSPKARLDRIMAAGFDGVYLDKCDVFDDMRSRKLSAAKARPDLEADMAAFVTRLSTYAKSRTPGFMVIMQNTEVLLERDDLRDVLDGVAKEELVYGVDSPEKKNTREEFDYSRERLGLMKRDGKLVLVVEYLDNKSKIDDALATITSLGFTPYISPKDRELAKLRPPPATLIA